jgi:hypothetical protein
MRLTMQTKAFVSMAGFLVMLSGCATEQPTTAEATRGVTRAERTAQPVTGAGERTPVIVGGVGVPEAEVRERLAEAAGSVVLEELVLDRALATVVAERGVKVTRRDVDAERGLLLRAMQEDAGLTEAQAAAMLDNVRRSRGLGPVRFEALLTRNAQLRALVRPEVQVSSEEVERALTIEFGPAFRARVIRAADTRELAKVRSQIMELLREPIDLKKTAEELEEEKRKPLPQQKIDLAAAMFAQWAVKVSTHESAPQGGLVAALSPADESFPTAMRESLSALRPGDVSEIYATADGAWMALVEKAMPARGTATDADRERVRARMIARRERMEMDRLARELVGSANVTVLDPGLRWSWEARPQ